MGSIKKVDSRNCEQSKCVEHFLDHSGVIQESVRKTLSNLFSFNVVSMSLFYHWNVLDEIPGNERTLVFQYYATIQFFFVPLFQADPNRSGTKNFGSKKWNSSGTKTISVPTIGTKIICGPENGTALEQK